MKKYLLLLLLLLCPLSVFASESIPIKTVIENTNNPIPAVFKYELKKHAENPLGVVNAPQEILVDFSDVEVNDNRLEKTVNIDFSNTTFPEEGIYRFGLSQKEVSTIDIIPSNKNYEIYVTVTNNNGSRVVDVNPLAMNFLEYGKESIEYYNTANLTEIQIESRVDGELKELDKDIYFRYKISINGPVGHHYHILGQEEEVIFDGHLIDTTNEYEVKNNASENYIYIYLKHNQKVIIGRSPNGFGEIPINVRYTVKKASGDKWLTRINNQDVSEKTFVTSNDDNYCLIVNRRDYDDAVTGLFYNYLPYLLLIGMIIFAIIVMIYWKKGKNKM